MERRKRRSPLDEYIDALEDSPEKLHKCSQFYQQLRQFYRRKWGGPLKVPHVQGVEVDLYKLYDTVVSMGGWQKVSITERWFEVAHALGIGDDTLISEHGIKLLYMRYLSKYEQCELTGDTDDHDNELLGSRNRNKGFSSFATSDNPISIPKVSEKPRSETVDTEYAKIIKAILSGLPNDVDFALNVCTIMSHPGPKMLRLSKCPQLITTLMAHVGIFDKEVNDLSDLYIQEWSKVSNRDFLGFWHNAGLKDPEVKALLATEQKILLSNGDDEFFAGIGICPEFDFNDPISWRISQILAIIRNWSFESINKPFLANNWALMKFLLICANCKWTTLVNHSLDVLSNISTDVDLSSDGAAMSNYLLLKAVSECIFSDDKLQVIRGLEVLAGLCNMDQNESIICEFLNDRILSRIFEVLSVKDIMLCIYTLESLYQLSDLGRVLCQRLSNFPHSVEVFVDLATTDAASFGQSGLAGIKVVEFQGPPQIGQPMHPPNRIPSHTLPSATPGHGASFQMRSLPPPMTPIPNPRMTLQRMPSSQNLPSVPHSPQRFAAPVTAPQLPAVSAALGHGQSNNASLTGESKLEMLTTKFIKDHCVADPQASTVRGEMYASYVDHMRNVHSILSGSVVMFCNTLKKCFPSIVIKSVRKPTEPPTMAYIIEGLRFHREPIQNGDHQQPPIANVASHPVMQQMLSQSPKPNHSQMNGGNSAETTSKSLISMNGDGDGDSRSETPESNVSEEVPNRIQPASRPNETPINSKTPTNEVRFEVCTAAVEARSLMGDHEKHETRIIRVENISQRNSTPKKEDAKNAVECNGNGVDHSNDSISSSEKEEPIEEKATTGATASPPDNDPNVSSEKHSNPGTPKDEKINGTSSLDVSMEESAQDNGSVPTVDPQNSNAGPSSPNIDRSEDTISVPENEEKPLVNGVGSKKKKSSPKKPSNKSKKSGSASGSSAGPFAADFASPRQANHPPSKPSTSTPPTGDFMCEWDACGRMFATPTAVLFHNAQEHVNESTMVCRWPSCDGTMRSRWSLVTHLQDHHCSEHILREASRKRHEIGEAIYMSQIKQLLEQTKEVSHHPGYSKHAAYEAIRRHAFNYMTRDLTDEPEGPVTKSIRLTSCLILRNLARYSAEGRRLLRKYEGHLSWMALSRLECSAALAQLLNELQQHAISADPAAST